MASATTNSSPRPLPPSASPKPSCFSPALRSLLQAQIRWTCRHKPSFFINAYCQVQSDAGSGLVPFHLFPYQTKLLDTFQTHREVIILKARQLGITELVAAYAIWKCLTPYQTVVAISQGEDEAGELVHKARLAWEHLPDFLRPPLKNPRLTSSLIFANGSRILPKPSTGRSGRGVSAHLLILDEWATQMDAEAVYTAAAPAATSAGNQIIGISTANGAGNYFHRQWEAAQDGHGMAPVFLPWHARPGRDKAWYDEATKTYTPSQCAEAYPATAEEAFTLSGRPVFDLASLAAIATTCAEPITDTPLGVDGTGRPAGYQRVWAAPVPGRRYVCGADTAEGKANGDYSAAVILDWEDATEVAELHGHWAPEEFATHLARLCTQYNHALLGVERNNHGHTVLLALAKLEHYTALYRHQEYDAKRRPVGDAAPGWQTSSKSKPIMIDALGVAIKEQRPFRSARFVAEARTYCVKDNGETAASGSLHDDRVIAYAIAEQVRWAPTAELPYAWLRNDAAFVAEATAAAQVPETDEQRIARRLAAKGLA